MSNDRFNPTDGQPYSIMFPFGDFKKTAHESYHAKVKVDGEDMVWFLDRSMFDFLMNTGRQAHIVVEVDRRSCEPEGIRPKTVMSFTRHARGVLEIIYAGMMYRSDAAPQAAKDPAQDLSEPPRNHAPAQSAPPWADEEPPPPESEAPPPVDPEERDRAVETGIAPKGSAPPRIARTPFETVALMDMALTNARRLAFKHGVESDIAVLANELFRSFAIGGTRIAEDKAKAIVESLKGFES